MVHHSPYNDAITNCRKGIEMETPKITRQYRVRRVIRDIADAGKGNPFAQRLEHTLNDLAADDWELYDVKVGARDAVVICYADFIIEDD